MKRVRRRLRCSSPNRYKAPAGSSCPQDDYFGRIREICDQYEVLLVADEVITGFGRTGRLFALDHWGIEPDIVQFAKAITSGYFPFGGIGINDTIAQILHDDGRPWMHAYTYSAHPVGCAVALRMLRIVDEENFVDQAAIKGQYLLEALESALGDHPHVGDIRGKGLMCAVELVQDKSTKQAYPASEKVGPQVNRQTSERGLFSRVKADTYVLAPPIVITNEQMDQTVEILAASIKAVLG